MIDIVLIWRKLNTLAEAYRTGAYSMQVIAEHFGVSRMTVSRAVNNNEKHMSAAPNACNATCET